MPYTEDLVPPPVEFALDFKRRSLLRLNVPGASLPVVLTRGAFSAFNINSFDRNSTMVKRVYERLTSTLPFHFPLHPVRKIHSQYHTSLTADPESTPPSTTYSSPPLHAIPALKLILKRACALLFEINWWPATPFFPASDVRNRVWHSSTLQRALDLWNIRELDTDRGNDASNGYSDPAQSPGLTVSRRPPLSPTPGSPTPKDQEHSNAAPAAVQSIEKGLNSTHWDGVAFKTSPRPPMEVRRPESLGAHHKTIPERKTEEGHLDESCEMSADKHDEKYWDLEDTVRARPPKFCAEPEGGAETVMVIEGEKDVSRSFVGVAGAIDSYSLMGGGRSEDGEVGSTIKAKTASHCGETDGNPAAPMVPTTRPSTISQRAPLPSSVPAHHDDVLPPRPSSPTPPELPQSPMKLTFGSVMSMPDEGSYDAEIVPPSSQHSLRKQQSAVSLFSRSYSSLFGHTSVLSPALKTRPANMSEEAEYSSAHAIWSNSATDPTIVHAIAQTFVGEFLYKYMRKTVGKGYGARHRRFFWVHPYTKMLYWSSADPRSPSMSESSAKSAYIDGVRSVRDPNTIPHGLYQYSILVSTPQRELKITASTKERHDIWLVALKHLLDASPRGALQIPPSPMSDLTGDECTKLPCESSKTSTSPSTSFHVSEHDEDLDFAMYGHSVEEHPGGRHRHENRPARYLSAWSLHSRADSTCADSINFRDRGSSIFVRGGR